jgi:hypothetical protein
VARVEGKRKRSVGGSSSAGKRERVELDGGGSRSQFAPSKLRMAWAASGGKTGGTRQLAVSRGEEARRPEAVGRRREGKEWGWPGAFMAGCGRRHVLPQSGVGRKLGLTRLGVLV